MIPLLTVNDQEMALFLREAKFLFARPGAGTTTEAVVCGTPMIFDLSRGVMPQEINNLNFWKSRNSKIIKTNKPKKATDPFPSLPLAFVMVVLFFGAPALSD